MKKIVNLAFAIVLVLGILLVNVPPTVEAKDTKVAEGAWNTGTEVDVDAQVPDNLNLLTKGVKVTKPGLICHPFNGGRFGWVGEIRQLKNGEWVKLKTTNDWYPDKEGQFMSCARAPIAGTYALFGYYNGPLEIVSDIPSGNPVDCSTVNWLSGLYSLTVDPSHHIFSTWFFNVPIGTPVTYTVTDMVPDNVFGGTLTGTGIIEASGIVNFGVDQYLIRLDFSVDTSVTIDYSFLGCTVTQTYIHNKLE